MVCACFIALLWCQVFFIVDKSLRNINESMIETNFYYNSCFVLQSITIIDTLNRLFM